MAALLLSDPLNGGFRAELAHARRNHDPFAALRGEQQVPAGIEYKWKMGRKQPGKLRRPSATGMTNSFLVHVPSLLSRFALQTESRLDVLVRPVRELRRVTSDCRTMLEAVP